MRLKKKVIFVLPKIKLLMRVKYCLLSFFLLLSYTLSAQEDPIFTFSPWLQSFYNPGAMGEKENHMNFTGVLRQHAIMMREVDDTEKTTEQNQQNQKNQKNPDKPTYHKQNGEQILLNIDSYIKQIKGAVGVTFLKDKNAELDNIYFGFGYATKIRVRGGKLGIGLQLGFLNMKPASDKWNANDNPDPTLTGAQDSESFLDFDMRFGLHYKAPTWYVGVSCAQFLGGVRISGEKTSNTLKAPQQLYFTGGYIWNLKTPVPWSIEPNVLIRTEFATWTIDVIALARYNGILWFGLAYQLDWGISALFGAVPFYNHTSNYLKGLELGVSYTFPTNKTGYAKNGSMGDFDILIRYGFNFYKDKALTGYGSSRHLYKNQY